METLINYPALVAEDAGFLKHLQESVINKHLDTLGFDEDMDFFQKVDLLRSENAINRGCGVTLPLYTPKLDDGGRLCGYTTEVAWSCKAVDFPLYGNYAKDEVASLVFGNAISVCSPDAWPLSEELMSLSPAFRVAILTHIILQNVLMGPLAAEAFVLGSYSDLPTKDSLYARIGVPSTSLVSVVPQPGISEVWVMDSSDSWHGRLMSSPKYQGWTIHVRGSAPKEAVLRQAWQEIKERRDAPKSQKVYVNGHELHNMEYGQSGRVRQRAGDPCVDRMVQIVDDLMARGAFPKNGSKYDWKTVHAMMESKNPELIGIWTADSMRRIYTTRKKKRESLNKYSIFSRER